MPNYKEHSYQQLLDLLKENNQSAFVEIYDRYSEMLHRFAYKWLQDRDAAKDVLQDIFTIIWTKRELITFRQNLSGYLYISVLLLYLKKYSNRTEIRYMRIRYRNMPRVQ